MAVTRALAGDGLQLELDGDIAVLTVDGVRLVRPWSWVGAGGTPLATALEDPGGRDRFLLVDRIPTGVAARARTRGQWFADALGNVHVRSEGVLVDVRGRRRPTARPAVEPTARATNLMSARRAQVVFCLLSWPELVGEPLRSVAEVAGVSPSLAQLVVRALREDGYLGVNSRRLDRRAELVDRWVGAYGRGLARNLELGRYVGEPTAAAWIESGQVARVSGEQAASELRGVQTLTLYVRELDPRLVASSRWRRAVQEATVIVRRQFWVEPISVGTTLSPVSDAPPLLVYADLLDSGEPRQREVAQSLREAVVGRSAR